MSTKKQFILLVAGSLLLLAVGAGLFAMFSVERTMLAEQRQSSINTVSLATLSVRDHANILLRNKTSQAVTLKERMESLQSILEGLAYGTDNPMSLLRTFPLPRGIALLVVNETLTPVLTRGLDVGRDPYAHNDIKGRPVGSTMLRLANKGLPATCVTAWDVKGTRQRFYATHTFLEEQGLLIGLWTNIDALETEHAQLYQRSVEELQTNFASIPLGPSGFLFVSDGKGRPVIGPDTLHHTFLTLSPDGNSLFDAIRTVTQTPETSIPVRAGSVLQDGDDREVLLFARYVKPLDWYVCGVTYLDEALAPGRALSLSLMVGILVVLFLLLPGAILLVTRLTAPLGEIANYARRLPEQDFLRDVPPSPLLVRLAGNGQAAEVSELARSFIFMDKTLRQRVRELMDAAVNRQRLEGELSAATEIQMGFLPKPLPPEVSANRFALSASLVPAREVGGDLYDFFMLDKTHLCVVIGDVSDKGVPASLFMSMTLTLIRSWAADLPSPEALMTAVNENLARDNPKSMFVTLFIGVLDLDTGELRYANGGHNQPLRREEDGTVTWIEGISGPVVGALDGMPYSLLRTTLNPGDVLFLYTDGLNEAMNARNEIYSNERMERVLGTTLSNEPYRVIQHILNDVAEHVDKHPASDDMTILCLHYIGPHARPQE